MLVIDYIYIIFYLVEIDFCTNTCQNGGTCSETANGFMCACPDTTTGMRCETGT